MAIFYHSLSRIENILDKNSLFEAPYPNCFGNLLSPQVVLTTLSCFRKVREVSEYFGEWSLLRRRIVQGVTQETDPTEIIVAKVTAQMIDFSNEFQCHMHFKTKIVDGNKVKADCIGGNSSGICTHFLLN